jgi:predicted transcriptional regulator of viral defense system
VAHERLEVRSRLHALAYEQAGFFSAAQARDVGYSYQAQRYNVDRGNWTRVGRGILRLANWPDGPWDSLVECTLWSGGRGVVSHESALVVHDLSDVNPAHVHLSVPAGFAARSSAVVLHPADLPASDVQSREGFRVTTPARTLIDIAAAELSQEHVDNAVAAAVDRGLISVRRLRDRADAAGDRAALRIERALT